MRAARSFDGQQDEPQKDQKGVLPVFVFFWKAIGRAVCIFIVLSLSMETIEKEASDKKGEKHFFESFKKKNREERVCVCVRLYV